MKEAGQGNARKRGYAFSGAQRADGWEAVVTSAFKVGNLSAESGEKKQGILEAVNCDAGMPVTLIHGIAPGQTVAITAGIHGGEYVGIAAAVQLAQELDPKSVSGKIAIVHVADAEAFYFRAQYYDPRDGKNLNRVFPGRALGTITERIAYTISTELHAQADFYIDMHGGDIHEDLCDFVICSPLGNQEQVEKSRKIAGFMGIEYISMGSAPNGTYGSAMKNYGVPGFLAEIGGRGLWSQEEVDKYKNGVVNSLKALGVLAGPPRETSRTYLARTTSYLAGQTGCWYPSVKAGEKVAAGQKYGEIRDFFGARLGEYACVSGVVLYIPSSLAIKEGDPLGTIGEF